VIPVLHRSLVKLCQLACRGSSAARIILRSFHRLPSPPQHARCPLHAAEAEFQVRDRLACAVNGASNAKIRSRIAASRFGSPHPQPAPSQRCRHVAAPSKFARPRFHASRSIGRLSISGASSITFTRRRHSEDLAPIRKPLRGLCVRKRPVQLFGKHIPPIGRRFHALKDSWLADLLQRAADLHLSSCAVA